MNEDEDLLSERIVDTEINNLPIMEDNIKLFILNNDKYRREDLIPLKVNCLFSPTLNDS